MQTDITDKILRKTITLEFPGGKLIYNFSYLNAWQCEMGHSTGLFAIDQIDNPAATFDEKINSGGANWKTTLMSYLFINEKDEGKTKDDLYAKVIKDIICPLKGEDSYPLFKEVIQDFFTGIGESWMISLLLPNKSKEKTRQTLLTLAQMYGSMNGNKTSLLKDALESTPSTTKRNSKKGKQKTL